jgi:DNA polymerase-3 subunit alpha
MFVNLRVRTEYSLLNSVNKIENIVEYCKSDNAKAICMMDNANLSSALSFSSKISKIGVKPIIGMNICLIDSDHYLQHHSISPLPYIGLIAKNEQGYRDLIEILNKSSVLDQVQNDRNYVFLKDLEFFGTNLICITGGYHGNLYRAVIDNNKDLAFSTAEKLFDIFKDNLYIEINRHGYDNEIDAETFVLEIAMQKKIPLVATNEVLFYQKNQYDAFDAMCCVGEGRFIQEDDRYKYSNEHYMKTQEEMIDIFSDIPEAIENTVNIAKRCNFILEERKPMLPPFKTGSDLTEDELFEKLVKEGLDERLISENIPDCDRKSYYDRAEYESSVIKKMGFTGYFLIVSDFICYAKNNNIPVGPGRGSGAGSIVAWALKITNLNPIHYGLLFERFLNPDRVSMPDFDIDLCQIKRDKVIEYVRNKYGNEHVAHIVTFGTMQPKATLKDIGRVMQIPYSVVDNICKMIPFSPLDPITIKKAIDMDENLRNEIASNPDIQRLIELSLEVEGLPRHQSTHAAGVIISGVPLKSVAPVLKDQNSDMPVLAFNMKDAEKIGLLKFDFLGLKTLSVIQETINLIKKYKDISINIDTIDIHDKKTFELLGSGKTKCIFQLEAAIPRETMHQIKTDKIEDIIAVTSLNRPGPMENIPSYIKRKLGNEKIEYMHDLLEENLRETYGIIIYQEQVMEVARVIAGYTLAEADLLRRAMGKKIKEEMDQQRSVFVKGAKKTNNIDDKKASEIFDLIDKFAGYGFNKSHAAAYSVISYQTAYLKANYAIEFFVANLNLEIDNTDKIAEFIYDAKSFGIKISMPNINKSDAYFTISNGDTIIYGLAGLKDVGLKSAQEMVAIRSQKSSFIDIFDFAEKCGHGICNKKQVESLILAGAFGELHQNKKQLFTSVEQVVSYASGLAKEDKDQVSLFGSASDAIKMRPKLANVSDMYTDQENMAFELRYIGFYLSKHPLEDYVYDVESAGIVSSSNLEGILSSKRTEFKMAGVITKIVQRFRKSGRFCFVHLSDLDGLYETTIFNGDVINAVRDVLFEGNTVVMDMYGSKDDSGMRISINNMYNISDYVAKFKRQNQVNQTHYKLKNTTPKIESKILNNNGESKIADILSFNSFDEYKLFLENGNPISARKILIHGVVYWLN